MPTGKLTNASVERIKPPAEGQIEYFDRLVPGFGMRVSYKGSKAWFVMCRARGKLIRTTIGRFPGISLGVAREKARAIKAQAEVGIDPRRARQEGIDAEARRQRDTFGAAAEQFLRLYVQKKLRASTVREYERALL